MESYPNVPTLVELGYNIVAPSIIGIIGPKGLPKDQVKILHDAFYKGIEDPGFTKALKTFDQPLVYKNSQDTQLTIKEIYESTGKLIEKNRDAMKN